MNLDKIFHTDYSKNDPLIASQTQTNESQQTKHKLSLSPSSEFLPLPLRPPPTLELTKSYSKLENICLPNPPPLKLDINRTFLPLVPEYKQCIKIKDFIARKPVHQTNAHTKHPTKSKISAQIFSNLRTVLMYLSLGIEIEGFPLNSTKTSFELPPMLETTHHSSYSLLIPLLTTASRNGVTIISIKHRLRTQLQSSAAIPFLNQQIHFIEMEILKITKCETISTLTKCVYNPQIWLTDLLTVINTLETTQPLELISNVVNDPKIIPLLKQTCYSLQNVWFKQLEFVLGLQDTCIQRTYDPEFKQIYFPDIFIDLNEKIELNYSKIPSFISTKTAKRILRCYQLLVIVQSIKDHNYDHNYNHNHTTHTLDTAPSPNFQFRILNGDKFPYRITDHVELKPVTLSKIDPNPQSIHALTAQIHCRINEINLKTKQILKSQLIELCEVVCGLFLYTDGVTWSLLHSILDTESITKNMVSMFNEVISRKYDGLILVYDSEYEVFFLNYSIPKDLKSILKPFFIETICQPIFNKIVDLYLQKRNNELLLYTLDLHAKSQHLKFLLGSEEHGIMDVISALHKI